MNKNFGRKVMTGATLVVSALMLASCSTPASKPSAPVANSETSAAVATSAPAPVKVTAYPVSENIFPTNDDNTPISKQGSIASAWNLATSKSGYLLSGDWNKAGSKGEDLAALWANYLSPRLLDELSNSVGVEKVATYSLASTDSSEDVRAHPECTTGAGWCDFGLWNESSQGILQTGQETIDMDSGFEIPVENVATKKYDIAIPVATGAGTAYQTSVLDSTLTFVANEDTSAGALPFLIDTVDHKVSEQATVQIDESMKVYIEASEKPRF